MAFYAGSSYQLNLPRTPDAFCTGSSMNASPASASSSRHYQNDLHHPYAQHHHQSHQYSQQHLGSTMSSLASSSAAATRAADLLHHGLKGWRASAVNNNLGSTSNLASTTSSGSAAKPAHMLVPVPSSSAVAAAATEGPGPLTPPMSTSFEARTTSTANYSQYQQQQYSRPQQQQQSQFHAYSNTTSNANTTSNYSNGTTTTTTNGNVNMTLPPIAHLERHLSHPSTHLPPLTPPEDIPHAHTSRLPVPHSTHTAPLPRISSQDDFFSSSSSMVTSTAPGSSGSSTATSSHSHLQQRLEMDANVLPPIQYQQQDQQHQPPPQHYEPHSQTQTQTLTPYTHTNGHAQPPLPPPSAEPCSEGAYMQTDSVSTTSPDQEPQPQPSREHSELAGALVPSENAPQYFVDWLDFTRSRSAHFVAEKTCEMICYLWFAPPTKKQAKQESKWKSNKIRKTDSVFASSNIEDEVCKSESDSDSEGSAVSLSPPTAPTALQLVPSATFVQFMNKLLETTQVSQSVIVLSLHYIHRLKQKNQWTPAQRGSEFRIAVAGLMMGNKFLDDNTYTNKTWSEVSGIELAEINRMEREFLHGVDFNLYVDQATYEAWLNLLKGLVLAKEKDCRRYGRNGREERHHRERERERKGSSTRRTATLASIANSNGNAIYGAIGPASRSYTSVAPPAPAGNNANGYNGVVKKESYSRARSTSPRIRSSSTRNVQQQPAPSLAYNQPPPSPPQPSQSQQQAVYTHQNHSYLPSINTTTALLQPTPLSSTASTSASTSSMISGYASGSPVAQTQVGGKRTAEAAFSPTSAVFATVPSKRPISIHGGMGISLRIPETNAQQQQGQGHGMSAGPNNLSPLEGLQSFERMSLTSNNPSPAKDRSMAAKEKSKENNRSRWRASAVPQTLSSTYSYSVENDKKNRPQNLYFYALACSPIKDEPAEAPLGADEQDGDRVQSSQEERYVGYGHGQRRFRKYHQPVPPSGVPYAYADLNANASRFYPSIPAVPAESTTAFVSKATVTPPTRQKQYSYPVFEKRVKEEAAEYSIPLPHFRDDVWARPPAPASSTSYKVEDCAHAQPPAHYHHQEAVPVPAHVVPRDMVDEDEDIDMERSTTDADADMAAVPSAPFANAGPPGVRVQFYDNGAGSSSSYAPYYQQGQSGPQQSGRPTLAGQTSGAPSQYGYGYSTPPYHASESTLLTNPTSTYQPAYSQSQYSSPVRYSSPPLGRNSKYAGYPPQLESPLRRHQIKQEQNEQQQNGYLRTQHDQDREQRYFLEEQERYHQRYSSRSAYSSPQYARR